MEMPGVGPLTLDEDLHRYFSGPVTASVLGGVVGQVVLPSSYVADDDKEAVHAAVTAFLTNDDSALHAASADAFAYYLDTVRESREQGWNEPLPDIAEPEQVWAYVSLGHEFHVERDTDGQVYVSIECECAWEPEHGLQLVLRAGTTITKLGPFDSHLTNTTAYARDDFANVIYVSTSML
ncbi:hypothetical protein AB0E69_14700 [Kribbella sp. NPDC026611]|uniref:DUF6985 domain-containing protein n=1 Tax=Kribbella sp. NPDC026611 TaxID=3154911 RepID=UPI0033C1F886